MPQDVGHGAIGNPRGFDRRVPVSAPPRTTRRDGLLIQESPVQLTVVTSAWLSLQRAVSA